MSRSLPIRAVLPSGAIFQLLINGMPAPWGQLAGISDSKGEYDQIELWIACKYILCQFELTPRLFQFKDGNFSQGHLLLGCLARTESSTNC
jgi:hypothetical protein